MTLKQRKFLKEFYKSGNASEAAMKVYNCKDRKSASAIGCQNLKKLQIDDSIQGWLEHQGLSDKRLAKNLVKATKANKKVFNRDKVVKMPDWQSRLRANEIALKLKNKFPAEKVEHTGKEGGALEYKMIIEE